MANCSGVQQFEICDCCSGALHGLCRQETSERRRRVVARVCRVIMSYEIFPLMHIQPFGCTCMQYGLRFPEQPRSSRSDVAYLRNRVKKI